MSKRREGTPGRRPISTENKGKRGGVNRLYPALGAAVVVVAVGGAVVATRQNSANPASPPAEVRFAPRAVPAAVAGAPIVAPGRTVDGVQCQASESVVYHIHAALALYKNGSKTLVPAYVGIPYSVKINTGASASAGQSPNICLYWLHTHDSSGVVHIESPTERTYTLGQFLDIWRNTSVTDATGGHSKVVAVDASYLTALVKAPAGSVHAYVNGKAVNGSYRNITLTAHKLITIEIGSPLQTPLTSFVFPNGE